jgi:hypothetical protein
VEVDRGVILTNFFLPPRYSLSQGVYVLSRDGKMASYVGRADFDLGERLRASVREGRYSHYWYEYACDREEAFQLECAYYHRYSPLDNMPHPAQPSGLAVACHFCLPLMVGQLFQK